jgi:hypothetical protein
MVCRFCVLLLSRNVPEDDAFRNSFRQFVAQNEGKWNRVKFAYVYEDAQSPFIKSVTWGRGVVNETLGALKVLGHSYRRRCHAAKSYGRLVKNQTVCVLLI